MIQLRFQHTAARGRLTDSFIGYGSGHLFQHTAARGRLNAYERKNGTTYRVSTHSRPWAAESPSVMEAPILRGFNTQPPVGG